MIVNDGIQVHMLASVCGGCVVVLEEKPGEAFLVTRQTTTNETLCVNVKDGSLHLLPDSTKVQVFTHAEVNLRPNKR